MKFAIENAVGVYVLSLTIIMLKLSTFLIFSFKSVTNGMKKRHEKMNGGMRIRNEFDLFCYDPGIGLQF